ncbi:MAG: rRNA maturation RNase YbeY [Alphaproteobacteria bacterium]|nr:rRNA maturation RNase YbeY [Alphaproteobacteria bacterium]
MPDGSSIEIDIRIASSAWRAALPNPAAAVRRAVVAALKAELPAKAKTSLSILLTDDDEMRKLNAGWRAKDKPTNVLSFPAENAVDPAKPPAYLGDVALGLATCRREAREQKKTLADHVTHLVVHGVLHLIGYDHMDDEQAEAMEPLETQILAGMGIADPYRMASPVKKATKKKAAQKKAVKKKTVKKKAAKKVVKTAAVARKKKA